MSRENFLPEAQRDSTKGRCLVRRIGPRPKDREAMEAKISAAHVRLLHEKMARPYAAVCTGNRDPRGRGAQRV